MLSMRTIRLLSAGAILGPLLFTLAWLILGFVSPGFTIYGVTISPYSPISAQISGLGLGSTAVYMNTAFVMTGLLLLVGLIGIFWKIDELHDKTPWLIIFLLAITPVGSILDGFYTINSGFIHYVISMLSFAAPIASFLVAGLRLRRIPGWEKPGWWLILSSPLTLVLMTLFFLTFAPTPQGEMVGVTGLAERVLVTEVLLGYAVLGWITLRRLTKRMTVPIGKTG